MAAIEIKYSKVPMAALAILALIFVPMGLGLFYSGITRGFAPMPLIIGSFSLFVFSLVAVMVFRSYFKSAKRLDDRGLKRGDGRELLWTDLSKVIHQIHYNRSIQRDILWRTEIHFRDGQVAWLIPTKVANWAEAAGFVAGLNCPKEEIRV